MKIEWQKFINDATEKKVFDCLSDDKWDFRTIEGIANSSGLSPSEIEFVISKYANLIRESPVRDEGGRRLFTLRSKDMSSGEIFNIVRGILSKST